MDTRLSDDLDDVLATAVRAFEWDTDNDSVLKVITELRPLFAELRRLRRKEQSK